MAKPSAMSVPGRIPNQRSALTAVTVRRGSTTTIFAPLLKRQSFSIPKYTGRVSA